MTKGDDLKIIPNAQTICNRYTKAQIKRLAKDVSKWKAGMTDLTFLKGDFREEIDWNINYQQEEFEKFKDKYGEFFDETDLEEMMEAIKSMRKISSEIVDKYDNLLRKMKE